MMRKSAWRETARTESRGDALEVPLDPSKAEAALKVKEGTSRFSQRRAAGSLDNQTHIPGAACLRYSKTSFVFLPLTSAGATGRRTSVSGVVVKRRGENATDTSSRGGMSLRG